MHLMYAESSSRSLKQAAFGLNSHSQQRPHAPNSCDHPIQRSSRQLGIRTAPLETLFLYLELSWNEEHMDLNKCPSIECCGVEEVCLKRQEPQYDCSLPRESEKTAASSDPSS